MAVLHGTLTPLDWESRFFNIDSCIVDIDRQSTPLGEKELSAWPRVQAKIATDRYDKLDALQQLGFRVVEAEVDLLLTVDPSLPCHSYAVADSAAIPTLRQQAQGVFKQSRFRPPWYQADDCGRFYAQWVENAVLGVFDHQCLVYDSQDPARGFVTLRQLSPQEARIGLLAGYGLGKALMAIAQTWCLQRGIKQLRVATQLSNTAALGLYSQCGATLYSSAFWLYR